MEKELYIRRHKDYAVFSKIFAGPVDDNTKQIIINLFNSLIMFAKEIQDDSLKNSLEFVINFLQKNNEEELNSINVDRKLSSSDILLIIGLIIVIFIVGISIFFIRKINKPTSHEELLNRDNVKIKLNKMNI